MGKNWLAALCAMLLSLFPAAPGVPADPPGGACRCLTVGIDYFVNETLTPPCSANNAETMAALFAACLPEGTRITRRVNGPGSTAEMETLILDAFGGAGEGDTSYLYISTHGVTWEEEDGTGTALILSDGVREEALEAARLREMMDRIPGRKVLILDCCHAGAMLEAFSGPDWRALGACAAEEDSYFWAAGEETGMGYFTCALENALRASDPEQIDPDGDGAVSLTELAARIREIYGAGSAQFLPEADGKSLFLLPKAGQNRERLLGFSFGDAEEADGQITLRFRFRTETAAKVEYRLVPAGEEGWDFADAARMPDREREGANRGVMSAGEKERTIKVSREKLKGGKALLEIISMRGIHKQVPVIEVTRAISFESEE